jgi:hypothetical protein
MTSRRPLLLVVSTVLLLAACTAAGSSRPPSVSPPVSSLPPAGGGSSGSDPGTGITSPVMPPPTDGPGTSDGPWDGFGPQPGEQATIVVPKPGRLDVHDVGVIRVGAQVQGGHLVVRLTWWSGVEPCIVLDSVAVARTGSDIRLTVREGADRLDVACIEIAMLKATLVDLGMLPSGTYTVSATGDAGPVQVIVP